MTTWTPPVTTESPRAANVVSTLRFDGIDLARFLAIAGMIVTHVVLPVEPHSLAAWANGNASTLFAVLAGVSAILSTRRHLAVGAIGAARVSLLTRALLLIGVGFALAPLQQPAVIVLVYLGAALAFVVPFLRVRTWIVATAAAVLAVAVPPINVAVRAALGVVNEGGSLGITDLGNDPGMALRSLFLTGMYPVGTWVVYLLVGMIAARVLVRAADSGRLTALAWRMAALGAAIAIAASAAGTVLYQAVVRPALEPGLQLDALPSGITVDDILRVSGYGSPAGYPGLLLDSAHTGSLLDLTRGVGIALAVIGACLLLCTVPRVNALLRPVRAAGAAPFTAYTLHILSLALISSALNTLSETTDALPWWAFGWGAAGLQLGALIALGIVLALLRRRGPLEALTSGVARRTARWARRPAGTQD